MFRKHGRLVPSHSTVVAYLALFVALGGTAYAANTVGSGDIIDGSILSRDVKNETLTGQDMGMNSIGGPRILNNSLTTTDFAGADISGHVSFSGVADGRCTQVTLGVGGAKTGEVPVVTTSAAMQNGIVLYAQGVPSDGHVLADICNFSGTAMTPITNMPVRVVTTH
jgi:hypothetical protein